MNRLIVYRGLPGAGKTTLAKAVVAEDPRRWARVNRDDLRAMAHDGIHLNQTGTEDGTERAIIAIRDAAISALLKRGMNVINDDTNLPARTVRDLRRLATLHGAEFEVVDLTGESVDVCVARDKARIKPVGENVIRDYHKRYIKGQPWPLPIPDEPVDDQWVIEPYKPTGVGPKTWIVDIDGTVALMGTRSPFDESRVCEDQPHVPVVSAVHALWMQGYEIIFLSGRKDSCRDATDAWLRRHFPAMTYNSGLRLFMRPATGPLAGETDWKVKLTLFNEHVRHNYDVAGVLDDRNQVVDMWRKLGLTCFQVADGNF